MRTKRCSKCEIEKPIAEFYWDKRDQRRYGACKACHNAITAANNRNNPRRRAWEREYRRRTRSRRLPRRRALYRKRRTQELIRIYAWRKQNHDRYLAILRRSYARHREKRCAGQRAYAKRHPEKVAAIVARQRARKRQAPVNDLTALEWQALLRAFRYRCAYCNRKQKQLTQDHLVPLIRGGDHTLTNVVPACRSCNSSKNRLTALEFLLRRIRDRQFEDVRTTRQPAA